MISCAIWFQAIRETIFLDSLLRSVREGHVSKGVHRRHYNKNLFSQVASLGSISRSFPQKIWERLGGTAIHTRKARLVGLLLALTRRAASALLELSSPTSTSWPGLCRWPDWAPCQLGACVLPPWDCSWSLQGHGPNSAASSTRGPRKDFFAVDDRRAVMCWLVLGGPCKAGQSPTRRFL
jgi:hypothetical protein